VTRPTRLALLAVLLLAAVIASALPRLLPPPAGTTPPPRWRLPGTTVRGAYHVHSTTSDGTGTVDDIAIAAARAGLQFVILTDHGDGTRQPAPPQYRSGVLCIDAVEINTGAGHLVALGARVSPFPLAGHPDAVLEDVHRLGGIGIAAHPGSPRESLRWKDWDAALDGLEWLNADSEWRDELVRSLGRMVLTYALRPAETLAAMLDRPDDVLQRADELTRSARIVLLAGADAHARLGFRQQTDPYREGWHLKVPTYEASFKAFSSHVVLDAALSGDAVRDAGAVLDAVRAGRVYTVVDGLATPGAFDFWASSGGVDVRMGEALGIAGEAVLHARMAAPAGASLVVLRDGEPIFDTEDTEVHLNVLQAAGAYRVEIYLPGSARASAIPWLTSNPIYLGLRDAHARRAGGGSRPVVGERRPVPTDAWTPEVSEGSLSRIASGRWPNGEPTTDWHFSLKGGSVDSQYAAARFPVDPDLAAFDRLHLRGRADRPMRVWIQLRAPSSGAGERWGQTIYLDDSIRAVDVFLDDLVSLGETSLDAPPLVRVDSLLLVVDTLNTRPGTEGHVELAELWWGRGK
jgi:hypothetical protein